MSILSLPKKSPKSEKKPNSYNEKKCKKEKEKEQQNPKKEAEEQNAYHQKGSCIDSCFWLIGCLFTMVCLLLIFFQFIPVQYIKEAIIGPLPDPPGLKLQREGLTANHPVVLIPGSISSGLELWEGNECAHSLFRKRIWGGIFGHLYRRPLCWAEHMSLDNETGLDPPGIRVRPVPGLVGADYFTHGYYLWAVLISNLAQIGYEEKTIYMATYDWRISFQNTQVRDQTLSRLKINIEFMVAENFGKRVVVVPHSMGVLYFLHFMKWVEAPVPMGGGGGLNWCARHIKAVMNIGGPFLGVPKAVAGLFSGEVKDVAAIRSIAPGFWPLDYLRLLILRHVMRMTRTWDSTMSMIPKGGDTIWGGLDWSPEDGYDCIPKKHKSNVTQISADNRTVSVGSQYSHVNYGGIISFSKDALSSEEEIKFRDAGNKSNTSCKVWTEYNEMGLGAIKAIVDQKVYTAGSLIDLLSFVAPKMMERGSAHFSFGIADDLDDPQYDHCKYWSNPLETRLPNAPDVEIYSLYGVGIPTERSYIYKVSSPGECPIPFQIDFSSEGEKGGGSCLKVGVHLVDGDETVPVLSAGFMFAKAWRGKTRFNPSGVKTFIREYNHSPPANLLEGRGTLSGYHVDILGNFALIEDVIRVAAGATGEDLGGDQVFSDIFKWSDKIKLEL